MASTRKSNARRTNNSNQTPPPTAPVIPEEEETVPEEEQDLGSESFLGPTGTAAQEETNEEVYDEEEYEQEEQEEEDEEDEEEIEEIETASVIASVGNGNVTIPSTMAPNNSTNVSFQQASAPSPVGSPQTVATAQQRWEAIDSLAQVDELVFLLDQDKALNPADNSISHKFTVSRTNDIIKATTRIAEAFGDGTEISAHYVQLASIINEVPLICNKLNKDREAHLQRMAATQTSSSLSAAVPQAPAPTLPLLPTAFYQPTPSAIEIKINSQCSRYDHIIVRLSHISDADHTTLTNTENMRWNAGYDIDHLIPSAVSLLSSLYKGTPAQQFDHFASIHESLTSDLTGVSVQLAGGALFQSYYDMAAVLSQPTSSATTSGSKATANLFPQPPSNKYEALQQDAMVTYDRLLLELDQHSTNDWTITLQGRTLIIVPSVKIYLLMASLHVFNRRLLRLMVAALDFIKGSSAHQVESTRLSPMYNITTQLDQLSISNILVLFDTGISAVVCHVLRPGVRCGLVLLRQAQVYLHDTSHTEFADYIVNRWTDFFIQPG